MASLSRTSLSLKVETLGFDKTVTFGASVLHRVRPGERYGTVHACAVPGKAWEEIDRVGWRLGGGCKRNSPAKESERPTPHLYSLVPCPLPHKALVRPLGHRQSTARAQCTSFVIYFHLFSGCFLLSWSWSFMFHRVFLLLLLLWSFSLHAKQRKAMGNVNALCRISRWYGFGFKFARPKPI